MTELTHVPGQGHSRLGLIVRHRLTRRARWRYSAGRVLLGGSLLWGTGVCRADPGDLWLQQHGLMAWQWDLDLDYDGLTVRQEYMIGGNPIGPDPETRLDLTESGSGLRIAWDAIPGQRFQVVESADFANYSDYGPPVVALDPRLGLDLGPLGDRQFFHLLTMQPLDRDDDGLSDLEEELISETDPGLKDTDGDTIPDDVEAIQHLGVRWTAKARADGSRVWDGPLPPGTETSATERRWTGPGSTWIAILTENSDPVTPGWIRGRTGSTDLSFCRRDCTP